MKLYWRPGLRVLWRAPGELQCGTDPPLIVFGVTQEEHGLLDAMADADSQLDCWMTAQRRGWSKVNFRSFIDRLPPELFVDQPTVGITATSRYWSLMGVSGSWRTARRDHGVVVDGVDSFGLQVAYALAEAGVGGVWLRDSDTVTVDDVEPSAFREGDIGSAREVAALSALRPRFPMTFLHSGEPLYRNDANSEAHSDRTLEQVPTHNRRMPAANVPSSSQTARPPMPILAVVMAHGACDLRRVRRYLEQGLPYLPVVVRDVDVMIGPLVPPVGGPCLYCVYLSYTDEDPRWPAVATQLASLPKTNIDPVVAGLAAALTAHQVTAIADGRPTAVSGMSLHVDGVHPIPRYKQWPVHPKCGCELRNLESLQSNVQAG